MPSLSVSGFSSPNLTALPSYITTRLLKKRLPLQERKKQKEKTKKRKTQNLLKSAIIPQKEKHITKNLEKSQKKQK